MKNARKAWDLAATAYTSAFMKGYIMTGEIIVAVLALIGTLVGSILASNKTQALIGYRLDQLEIKVEKHNQVIERTAILERDLKTAFNKIDELKTDVRELEGR